MSELIKWLWMSTWKACVALVDLWPLNILIISVMHSWKQGDGMLILAILFLVMIDTLSKAGSIICKEISERTGVCPDSIGIFQILKGFWKSIEPSRLNSRDLFKGLSRKFLLYVPLILLALMISDNRPRMFGGINAIQVLADSIYLSLILVELFSVLENFKDSGSQTIDGIKRVFCAISEIAGLGKIAALLKDRKDD